jgi:hypothetical protein
MQTFTQTQPRDPARHPWNVLADFIEAIDDKQVQQEIQVFVSWERKVEVGASSSPLYRRTRLCCGDTRVISHCFDAVRRPILVESVELQDTAVKIKKVSRCAAEIAN